MAVAGVHRSDVLVFGSRGMLADARRFKKLNPRITVIVFSGAIVDEEVILLDKGWNVSILRTLLTEIIGG